MTSPDQRTDSSRPDIREYAIQLAESHTEAEQEDSDIYVSWEAGEVRLIEIAERAPAINKAMPFRFSEKPERGLHFPAVVLLVNPDIWRELSDKSDFLPDDWDFGDFVSLDDLD